MSGLYQRIDDSVYLKVFNYVLPIVICSAAIALDNYNLQLFITLVQEDGIVEYATAILYFISFILCLKIAKQFIQDKDRFSGRIFFLAAVVMFLVCGEEISWGQRLFGLETPEYLKKYNVQHEINLHNISAVQYTFQAELLYIFFIFTGLLSFSWPILQLFDKRLLINKYFIPDWYLANYFLVIFFFTGYYEYVIPHNNIFGIDWRYTELIEFMLGLAFFMFFFMSWLRLNKDSKGLANSH